MAQAKEIDTSVGIDSIIESGFLFLEDGQWAKAKRYFDKAIEIAPRNAYSYLGRLLATLKLNNIEALQNPPRSYAGSSNFKNALRFADSKLQEKLLHYQKISEDKLHEIQYSKACELIESAKSLDEYKKLITILSSLGDYKNAKELLSQTKSHLDILEMQNAEKTKEDSPNISKNFIAKLWNNVNALYVTSAILFAISLIITAIINIGFILVELIGIALVVIMAFYFNSWEFFSVEDFSKVLFVAIIIGLILMIFALIIEGPNVNIGWQEEWHKCSKCNGSGKVKNDYGWNVTCPRCNGAGGLSY